MSFLTPLYIAGILAVSLPIIFHLIRRTPQEKQVFSSLMFLAPTPPRLTRKSRLSNILLLILRAAALTLLALAFSRPFLQQSIAGEAGKTPARRIAILVDTSASMRRGDLWNQAQKQVDHVLANVAATDEVSLLLFDKDLRTAFTFEQWNRIDPSQRVASVCATLAGAQPTWASTNLGSALAGTAEQIAATENKDGQDSIQRKIILVSDLQQGSHAEALQGHQWPDKVVLEIKPVTTDQVANASLQLIQSQPDAPDSADDRPRIRITNSSQSNAEQFSIAWANEKGAIPTTQPQKVYVPPGRGQVVRVDWPKAEQSANHLLLKGDASDFDNSFYIVRPRQETIRVAYLGDDQFDDPKGLGFYLQSALGDTPQRRVELIAKQSTSITSTDLLGASLVVITKPLESDQVTLIQKYLEAGGEVLWVLRDSSPATNLEQLTGLKPITIDESPVKNFSLVSRVDLQHPLFAVFADSRFSDFSQVHFWKHRTIKLPESGGAKSIAWFDNGDPFLVEKPIGKGRLLIATSGWQPTDSQFALSTKFVPVLNGMIRPKNAGFSSTQYDVGQAIPPPEQTEQKWTIKTPDNREIDLSNLSARLTATDRPGIYTISNGAQQFEIAVNLSPDESRTTPLLPSDFKQWGAKFEDATPTAAVIEQQRQFKYFELENRQKIWQWLLLGVIVLIATETALAGKLARKPAVSNEVAV